VFFFILGTDNGANKRDDDTTADQRASGILINGEAREHLIYPILTERDIHVPLNVTLPAHESLKRK